jgi:hypothetical protein
MSRCARGHVDLQYLFDRPPVNSMRPRPTLRPGVRRASKDMTLLWQDLPAAGRMDRRSPVRGFPHSIGVPFWGY